MTRSTTVTLVLLAFGFLLLGIAIAAGRRTHNAADYLLANRRLDVWSTALGFVGSAINAWTLIVISAAAFTWGLSAVWLWGAFVFGTALNVWYVAPRLRSASSGQNHATLTQVISSDAGDRLQPVIARSAAAIVLIFLLLQIVVATRAAAEILHVDSGFEIARVVFIGVILVAGCVLAGGLRAASACDAAQTIAMLVVATVLSIAALVALDSSDVIVSRAALGPELSNWFAGRDGVVAVAFAAGSFSLGFAMLGQPHAMVRFIASKDEAVLRKARWIALAWATVLMSVVLICGWCARLLYDGLQDPTQTMVELASRLLPTSLGALLVISMALAVLLSIASPMLAIGSQFVVEFKHASAPLSSAWTRFGVVCVAVLAIGAAQIMPVSLLEHSLLAFSALGAAFGPLLLVRLSGKRIRPGSVLGAMWAGFVLTLLFHLLPDSPGDFLERVLPFVAALGIALTGGERRRNPDRADRSQETVHDRIPI